MYDSYVFLAITTQSSVLHLSNIMIILLCIKCIVFCKFIGGETTHHRCLVIFGIYQIQCFISTYNVFYAIT